jgi:hypothetical protein
MKKEEKTANDWLSELLLSTGSCAKPDDVPEGWMTIKQMAKLANAPESTMKHRVDNWIKRDLVIKKSFKIFTGRQVAGVAHYIKK